MTDSQDASTTPADSYGVGPFTVREVSLLGVWVIAFIVSFFPIAGPGTPSVWTSGLLWILTIGVPTVAVGLLVLRRFSPDGIRRVGSLAVDQFASVAFSVAAVMWLQFVWAAVVVAVEVGGAPGGWVQWVELVLMLAGVVLTVGAPLIPVFARDFDGRTEIPAHRAARPVRPVTQRPARERAPKPAKQPKAPKPARGGQPAAWEQGPGVQRGQNPYPAQQSWDPNASAPQPYAPLASAPQGYAPQGYEPQASAPQAYDQQSFAPQGYDQQSSAPSSYGQQSSAPQGYDPQSFAPQSADPQASGTQRSDSGVVTPDADDQGYQPGVRRTGADDDPFAVFDTNEQPTGAVQPLDQTGGQPAVQQAFWALVPVERDVVDQSGAPLFRIGPTAWALVIEDRGSVFVVRDEDGRTGFLLDTSGVMRG